MSARPTDKAEFATPELYAVPFAVPYSNGPAGLENDISDRAFEQGKNILETCRLLLDNHGGESPDLT